MESCLTSNIQTSTVPSLAAHPLKQFPAHGIAATINTDDPAVEGIEIAHEYNVAAPAAGLTQAEIEQAQINGLEIAFYPQRKSGTERNGSKTRPVSAIPVKSRGILCHGFLCLYQLPEAPPPPLLPPPPPDDPLLPELPPELLL